VIRSSGTSLPPRAAARRLPDNDRQVVRPRSRGCFHGGAFFDGIGDEFDALDRRHEVIPADVLDAWFPPAPGVIAAVRLNLEWALRTSPPTHCEGLARVIARTREVAESSIVVGAGSSDLIFRALPRWLGPNSRVLLPEPTYGEYAHVLEHVVGCRVDRLPLLRATGYQIEPEALAQALERRYDMVIIVNPNSPTGRHVRRSALETVLASAPRTTRFWFDETYIEYSGPGETLESVASRSRNVTVCKSMSKVYALSGARVAYLVAAPEVAGELRRHTPPWVVGFPARSQP